MNRSAFHQQFNSTGPVVLPVIHVIDAAQTAKNIQVLLARKVPGAFLINHDFPIEPFLPIIRDVRERFPQFWLGLNFLAVTGKGAFPVLAELQGEGCRIDAYWADDARIDESRDIEDQPEAEEISGIRKKSGWKGLYFGGTAFKKQREVSPDHYGEAASIAAAHMDVVTTSGVATGQAADLEKIATFRRSLGAKALALASGITPENADLYGSDVDCFMVATGINYGGDFYNIDPDRLAALLALTRRFEENRSQ